jgi:adenylate cyclase
MITSVDTATPSGHDRTMPDDITPRTDDVAVRWAEFGLFDPDAPDAADTLEILAYYESVGIDPSEYVGADPQEVIDEVSRRMYVPGGRVDGEIARTQAGLTVEQFEIVCRAAGYDPNGTFSELDIRAFAGFAAARSFFTEEEFEPFIRVLRTLMGHLADAMTALFRIDVSIPMDKAGATRLDIAKKNVESARLIPGVPVALEAFLMHQLHDAILRSDASRQRMGASGSTTTVDMSIGFVDIVGYTPLADRLDPDELGRFVLDFERRATDTVVAGGGRVVKMIGDEIMFVVVDPGVAFSIAQDLVAAFADTDGAPRGGVVFGEVVARGGDYYGRLVNMASRIADLAIPGEILTDTDTAEAARGHEFGAAGRRLLKGFAEPVELRSLR